MYMKLLSWNINMVHGKVDIPNKTMLLVQYIKDLDPNVLFLQETCLYTNNKISELGYTCHGMVRTHSMFCSILAKNTLDKHITNIKKYHQMGQSITVNGIEFVNCHLVPFKENSEQRIRQLDKLDNSNTLIMGDFNTDKDLSFKNLKEIGNSETTWNLSFFQRGCNLKKKFDRVFTDIEIKEFAVRKILFSDHYPIQVTFEIDFSC